MTACTQTGRGRECVLERRIPRFHDEYFRDGHLTFQRDTQSRQAAIVRHQSYAVHRPAIQECQEIHQLIVERGAVGFREPLSAEAECAPLPVLDQMD